MPRDERNVTLLTPKQRWSAVAVVALVLAVLIAAVPLDTRDAAGRHSWRTTLEVWVDALSNLPAGVPGFLSAWVLAPLLLLALVAFAWLLVAVWELVRATQSDDDSA